VHLNRIMGAVDSKDENLIDWIKIGLSIVFLIALIHICQLETLDATSCRKNVTREVGELTDVDEIRLPEFSKM